MAGGKYTQDLFERIRLAGGEELVFPLLREGMTVTAATKWINENVDTLADMSRGMLSTWCNMEERKERYLEARRVGAGMQAEDAMDIVDAANPLDIQVARERANMRKWLSSKMDKETFGDGGVNVHLNVANLHLDAVREMGKAPPARLEEQAIEGEFTVDRVGGSAEEAEPGDDDWLD